MTEMIVTYGAVSLVLGGSAAAFVIWMDDAPPSTKQREAPPPTLKAIGIGLIVAIIWPSYVIHQTRALFMAVAGHTASGSTTRFLRKEHHEWA